MAYILAGEKESINGVRAQLGLPPWQIPEADELLIESLPPRVKRNAPAGWMCSGCGHGYAPWVPECHHCPVPPAFIAKGVAA